MTVRKFNAYDKVLKGFVILEIQERLGKLSTMSVLIFFNPKIANQGHFTIRRCFRNSSKTFTLNLSFLGSNGDHIVSIANFLYDRPFHNSYLYQIIINVSIF